MVPNEEGSSMAEQLVTVESFWNVSEAHLAKNVLQEAGIQAFLANENTTLLFPFWLGRGVRLKVKRSDVQKALEALKLQG